MVCTAGEQEPRLRSALVVKQPGILRGLFPEGVLVIRGDVVQVRLLCAVADVSAIAQIDQLFGAVHADRAEVALGKPLITAHEINLSAGGIAGYFHAASFEVQRAPLPAGEAFNPQLEQWPQLGERGGPWLRLVV